MNDDEPYIEHVDPKNLQPGPIRHPDGLPAPLEKWARSLYERIGFHIYDSFEQWELGFMRDLQPQNEMFVWEAIGQRTRAGLLNIPIATGSMSLGS